MTADAIVKALGGRKVGNGWMACCVAHQDGEPSLTINDSEDGEILVHCRAGCDQRGIIAVLRSLGLWRDYHAGGNRFQQHAAGQDARG